MPRGAELRPHPIPPIGYLLARRSDIAAHEDVVAALRREGFPVALAYLTPRAPRRMPWLSREPTVVSLAAGALGAARRAAALAQGGGLKALVLNTPRPVAVPHPGLRGVATLLLVDSTPAQWQLRKEGEPRLTPTVDGREWWYKRGLPRATRVVASSDGTARSTVEDYGVDPRRVTVVPPRRLRTGPLASLLNAVIEANRRGKKEPPVEFYLR